MAIASLSRRNIEHLGRQKEYFHPGRNPNREKTDCILWSFHYVCWQTSYNCWSTESSHRMLIFPSIDPTSSPSPFIFVSFGSFHVIHLGSFHVNHHKIRIPYLLILLSITKPSLDSANLDLCARVSLHAENENEITPVTMHSLKGMYYGTNMHIPIYLSVVNHVCLNPPLSGIAY